MKILFIGDIKEDGKHEAPALVSWELFKSLEQKSNISYITYFKEGHRYSRYDKLFGKEIISSTPEVLRLGLFPLIGFLLENNPDIIHFINLETFYIILYPFAWLLRAKCFFTVHGYAAYEHSRFNYYASQLNYRALRSEWLNIKFCSRIIFLSEKTARLVSLKQKVRMRSIVLDNGINTSSQKKFYNEEPVCRIAFIGNESREEKGFDILLNYLQDTDGEYQVNVYGSEESWEKKTGNICIKYFTWLEGADYDNELLSNDIVIVPSRYDTFNTGLLKCMNLGILFIASDRTGLTERFDDVLKKFVFRYNSKQDFLEKLKYIQSLSAVEKNELSRHLVEFSSKFSWENIAERYLEAYGK
jgi:glycosyltransferase involved in cell wall biosynthesis